MSRIVFGLALVIAIGLARAQEIPRRIGEPVPALHFAVVFQSAQAIPRKGHPLLIEYWASWCGPCIANIPHLKALANEFERQGVDFLMLTNQASAEVVPFLQKHPMPGMVASDPGFSTNRLLRAPGLPFTLLIDGDGKLAAVTLPDYVTPQVLQSLLESNPLPLASLDLRLESDFNGRNQVFNLQDVGAADANAAVRVIVRLGNPHNDLGTYTPGNATYFVGTLKLRDLLLAAYQVAPQQIVLPDDLNAVYSVDAWEPDSSTVGVLPLVQAAVLSAANLRVREEIEPMKVTVLRSFPGKMRNPQPHDPVDPPLVDFIRGDGSRIYSRGGVHAEALREELQEQLGEPVVLENAAQGTFAVDIHWDPNSKGGIRHAYEQAGMPLREETRPMKVLIFSAAEKDRP